MERRKSFLRDQLYAVANPAAVLSLRQAALYEVADVEEARRAMAMMQPGPLGGHRGGDREEVQADGEYYAVESILEETQGRHPMVLLKWVGYEVPQCSG